ncbi:MAG: MetQ/NlpA family ABC transporter substrate-binding protein [Treponema sp.]|nr:MetQ/NlpA family ABC transporter substrate-binding protein [Candidatus Treponema equifaecale]
MKKILSVAAAVLALAVISGCKDKKAAEPTTASNAGVIKVGATPEPHAAILNLVKDDLKAEGIDLQVIEFTDYVTPNEAVESGDIDANYFQHIPYMDSFNQEKGTHLFNAAGIHVEPFALYSSSDASKAVASVADIKEGASIAIPNDPTNEGRALLLLQEAGLITLKENVGLTATPIDVVKNDRKIKFVEVEAASLPRTLSDVNAAVINGNYAIPAGLSAAKDGLFVEGSSSPYVNILCVKEGNQDKAEVQALIKALKSEKVKNYISEKYPNGEVVVVF